MKETVKFITLKWGTKYGPEYVNRLHDAIKNTYSGPFEFYCFTDNSRGLKCRTYPIEMLPHFKSNVFTVCKLDLFNKMPMVGPYVLLDLDLLVLRDLKPYFDEYQFREPRMIYNYWTDPERIYRSYYTGDCYVNSSFVTWTGDQLKWMHDKFVENKEVVGFRFKTFDKFIFYSSRKEIGYHPRKTVYAYSFGAEYPEDRDIYKYRPDYYISIFNTSHKQGIELHEAGGWARDKWTQYDRD